MNGGRQKFPARLVLLLAGVLLLAPAGGLDPAGAQENVTTTWRFSWTPPESGSPPVYYVAEIRRDGKEVQRIANIGAPTLIVATEYGHDYEICIAAVDAFGRQGPFSDWSVRETCELITPSLD